MINALDIVAPTFDYATLDLSTITTNFTSVLAVAVPFSLGIMGVRKGISWLFGMIRNS